MGMQFEVSLNGRIEAECEAEDLGLDLDNSSDYFGDTSSDVQVTDLSVAGTVTLSAYATVEGQEVEAADLADYDAEAALTEHVGAYGGVSVQDADFEITRSPTGFEAVESAIDRDSAIAAYAALAGAGYEVV